MLIVFITNNVWPNLMLLTGLEQGEMAQVFEEWNKGDLDSFLIEITRDILKYKDADGKTC